MCIKVILGIYRDYIRGYIGVIQGLCRDNSIIVIIIIVIIGVMWG